LTAVGASVAAGEIDAQASLPAISNGDGRLEVAGIAFFPVGRSIAETPGASMRSTANARRATGACRSQAHRRAVISAFVRREAEPVAVDRELRTGDTVPKRADQRADVARSRT